MCVYVTIVVDIKKIHNELQLQPFKIYDICSVNNTTFHKHDEIIPMIFNVFCRDVFYDVNDEKGS